MELLMAMILFAGMIGVWMVAPNGNKSGVEISAATEEETLVTA